MCAHRQQCAALILPTRWYQGKTLSRRRSLLPSFTPSMAAGVTDKLWEMSDMVKVLEDWEVAN
jgi:hypothetical protein